MEMTWIASEITKTFPQANCLGDCIAALTEVARGHNAVVCEIIANGLTLTEEQEAMYRDTPITELDSLKVTTQDIETLLDESRVGCHQFLDQLGQSFDSAAKRFRAEDLIGAHRYYRTCIEGAQLFVEMLGYYKTVHENARGPFPDSWSAIEDLMTAELRLVLEAYEQKNYILVADLLEYELTEIFTHWQQELSAPQPPKVLFVDDEDAILAAARRLLRGKNIQCLTTSSPKEALSLLEKEDCWVIVSDYRMPEMTGTELLEEVKKRAPHVSRLMLTGFLELPIIQEAINRASVFRFITKPWDETELLLGIETAIQHSGRQRMNSQLAHEIGVQNQKLETLTKNLEGEVLKRTQGIEESRRMAEGKQKLVRELTSFVKDLSSITDVPRLYEVLFYELTKFQGVSAPQLLIFSGQQKGKLFWIQHDNLHEKAVTSLPPHFESLGLRTSSPEDREWWTKNVKREFRQLVTIPIRAREIQGSKPVALLIVEHDLNPERFSEFLDRMTERLQGVSIVLDKILLREQLVSASRQWEATFNGFRDPVAIVDNQERVIRANRSFMKNEKDRCYGMLDNRTELCVGCPMPTVFTTLEPTSGVIRPGSPGSPRSYRVHSYPVVVDTEQSSNVARVVNHYTDISNERELYLKLVQSEKLAAVGLLAGNIAHELNNPLSGIRAMAQITQRELAETNPHRTDLQEVEKAAVRCQRIIRNLLNFSEPESMEAEKVEINELIESTLPLLKTALRNHNLQTYFGKDLSLVKVQSSQLQQVIFNLVNNACQAMASGGSVSIKSWQNGADVFFAISDTGPGIPEDIRLRIFEPFFTTKGVGSGTGLGLSVSRSIVEKFGGTLQLSSEMGVGTVFTVTLPAQSGNL